MERSESVRTDVYVVSQGSYSDGQVIGVYSTPEAALAVVNPNVPDCSIDRFVLDDPGSSSEPMLWVEFKQATSMTTGPKSYGGPLAARLA